MPVKLNLIPPELSSKTGVARAALLAKNFSIILLVVFIVFLVGAVAFFIVSSFESSRLLSEITALQDEIKGLQTTEQRMVLLKDRISKIKLTDKIESADKEIENVSVVLGFVPQDAVLTEINTDIDKIDMSVRFLSRESLNLFLTSLSTTNVFSSITLTSFGFNPLTGYLVGLSLKAV